MDPEIHSTATCVCMFTNDQQTQSQWPQSRGPVSLLFSAMPLIDNQHNTAIIEFYHFYI